MNCPPNTPCPPPCGERARERVTSRRPRTRKARRSWAGEGERKNPERAKMPQPAMLRRDLQGMSLNMASPAHVPRAEVVIGGAGFAGLALAIALRQGLGNPFAVTVIDPALAHAQSKDPRASAIAAAARRLFE